MLCEICNHKANYRNPDNSLACGLHSERGAVSLTPDRRTRLKKFATEIMHKTEARLKVGGATHNILRKAYWNINQFNSLREDYQNAGQLQRALILGLIQQHDGGRAGAYRYLITVTGIFALRRLDKGKEGKFVWVNINPSKMWADHAQNFIW